MPKVSSAPDTKPPARKRARRQTPTLRRQDLLAVTIDCLARLGPRGTTGREICRQAGVSHGLLRHYFRNPDNLLYETYEEVCDQFVARLEAVLADETLTPWDAIDRYFAVLYSEEWANANLLGAWMAFWTMVRSNAEFAAKSEEHNIQVRELLRLAMSRLPTDGTGIPVEDAVVVVSALMDGMWLDICLSPTRTPRDRALDMCCRTVRKLIPPLPSDPTAAN
ncbi:MAG: TetR/AcrR family transcriptional regulator [Sphingomonas sp.]|nr:TetR/AcrR family transcriptional regulator [Sphingomonas sp.]